MSIDEESALNSFVVMRRLKEQNIPSHKAEAIVDVITAVSNDALQYSLTLFAKKKELEKSEMTLIASHSTFKYELKSFQENYISSLQRKCEEIKTDNQKREIEISSRIHDDTMEHRLKLQHEKLCFREKLSNKIIGIHKQCHNLNAEFQNVNAQLEAARYDILKYCVGIMMSISGATIAMIFRHGGWMPSSMNNQVHEMSVNEKGTFEVDSLALHKRRLEGHGILSHQAEAIINAITEVTNDALQHSSALFVTNEQLKMSEKIQEINHLKFTHEINMLKDNHVSSVQRQINLLRADIEEGRTELSCAMSEATMGRHLELQSKKLYLYGGLSKEISKLK